jgi:hypothetical protein
MIDNEGWNWYNKQVASGITRGEYFDRLTKAWVSGELGGKDDPYAKDRYYGLFYYGQANLIDIPAKTKLSELSTLGEHGYTGKDKSTSDNSPTNNAPSTSTINPSPADSDATKTQGKLMTKQQWIEDFKRHHQQTPPTEEQLEVAKGWYWQ